MAYGVAGLAGIAVSLSSGTAGAGWFFAALVITPGREYPVQIRSVNGDEVTLTRNEDTERAIPLSLVWAGGHGRLGDIVKIERSTVVRKLHSVGAGEPKVGLRAFPSCVVFEGDPRTARGLDYTEVDVPGELGDMPAWLVPGADPDTWVIAVHGRGGHRGEAMRILPDLQAAGPTTLVMTYRNDEGAPSAPDGFYHLGATEWRDLMAGVEFARANGAKRIILYGWSMGGAIVLHALRNGALPDVVGVIMDCPVIDWVSTLRMQAAQRRLPGALTWSALRLVEQRIGERFAQLDFRGFEMPVPTLILLDGDDRLVAPVPTREFAAANPSTVTLYETRGGGHVRSWNVDPEGYSAQVTAFLKGLARG
ncbi:alpha/beta hydrolase [Virgisporangium aliadipatigenens]|uniref:Alpha/beta hydrolase n=1 Tax=Virgisporangium aliadipatigenens TaxID=741659 RepID=A0A8J3YXN6_9ACTN|nr:alpha/beta hydrolase [Virgisporangium aliadipatigenens]